MNWSLHLTALGIMWRGFWRVVPWVVGFGLLACGWFIVMSMAMMAGFWWFLAVMAATVLAMIYAGIYIDLRHEKKFRQTFRSDFH